MRVSVRGHAGQRSCGSEVMSVSVRGHEGQCERS